MQVGDLTAQGSLPRARAQTWARDPARPVLLDAVAGAMTGAGSTRDGWCSAGELDEVTREKAHQLARLGLGPGDRVLWSTGSSTAAVAANVAALRAGLVVVPVNAAYTERELAHVVGDVRPAAAVVDDPDRARVCRGGRCGRRCMSDLRGRRAGGPRRRRGGAGDPRRCSTRPGPRTWR